MAILRRIGKWLSVLGVVLFAAAAGLFLAGCRQVSPPEKPKEEPKAAPPQTPPSAEKGQEKGTQKAADEKAPPKESPKPQPPKGKGVDVEETEQGQPVPRNLLE
jgi:cytoskeletal protein RodZ